VFFTTRLLPFLPALESGNAGQIASMLLPSRGFIILGLVVPLVMSATAATSILRYIVLGDGRESRSWIHVATGPSIWRLMGVTLILSAILILTAFLVELPMILVANAYPPIQAAMPIVIILALIIVASRWLMAYPIAAITGRIDLDAAWALTKPIYGRMLAVVSVTIAGIVLVNFVVNIALVPIYDANPGTLAQFMKHSWPVLALASFASNLFTIASFFTLLGIVYRLRVPGSEPAAKGPVAPVTSQPDEPLP
jgi:hypothetical protein